MTLALASVISQASNFHNSHKFLLFERREEGCPRVEPETFGPAVACSIDGAIGV